jgi:hypothetical protein
MKTKILITSIAITLISSLSFANSVIENNVLGRTFCQNNNGHITGWRFAKDGIAHNINSLAGMPSPFSFFQVEYIAGTDQFTINEYSKNSKELINEGKDQYEYDSASDELRSGNVVLSAKQCGN